MAEIYILDQDDRLLTMITEETGLIEAPFREELNRISNQPFSFTVEADTEEASYIVEENQVAFRDKEGDLRLFIIKELDELDDADGPQTTAICMPAFAEELQEHIVVERSIINQSAQVALDAALVGTRWTGVVEGEFGQGSTQFHYISSAVAVWNILEIWGGDVKDVVVFDEQNHIVARNVMLLQRLGADNGKRFEIDHDMTEIQRTILSYPVTALYGQGASLSAEGDEGGDTQYLDFTNVEWNMASGDPTNKPLGQAWVGDPQALQKYGRQYDGELLHREGIWQDQDIEDPELLLQKTWEHLPKVSVPEVHYRLSVHLLEHMAGYEHERVSLGDSARAIDRQFSKPIEIQTRIIAVEYDLTDIEGTAMVEMGQFLSVHEEDDRIDRIEADIDRNRGRWDSEAQPITNERYPNIKPQTPANARAEGGFQVIQLYWDYSDEVYVHYYEVYGSQVKDFVPDRQHLLWRGKVGAFAHNVETDQQWYYRIRAVNTHGTASDFTNEVTASTVRVITDDLLFGEDMAARLRELNEISRIIGENGVDFDQISEVAKETIHQEAKQYTDVELEEKRQELMQEIAKKAGLEYVDGKLQLKVDQETYDDQRQQMIDDLQSKADEADMLNWLSNKANMAEVEDLLDGKADLTYVNGQLADKVNVGTVYTKKEIDDQFENAVSVTEYETDQQGIITRLDSNDSHISQSQADIRLRVKQLEYDNKMEEIDGDLQSIGTTLTAHETWINLNAEEIQLRATKSEVETIEGRMSDAESAITVQAGLIEQRVTLIEYTTDQNNIISRLDSAESGIVQNADMIQHRVTTTAFDHAVDEINDRMAEEYKVHGTQEASTDYLILLCRSNLSGEHNYVLGTLSGKRVSGYMSAGKIDIVFNNSSDGTRGTGFIELMEVQTINKWSLVTCIYNGDEYIALRHEPTNQFHAWTHGINFYGQIGSSGEKLLWVEPSHVSDIQEFQSFENVDSTTKRVETRVEQAESSITQLSDQIELRATKTEVNSLSNRLTQAESTLTIHSNEISAKVDVNGVVSALNLSSEGVRIKGSLIHLDGLTLINNGVIKNSHIENLSAAKVTTGTMHGNRIQANTLNGNRITAGTITADHLNVANLAAVSANLGEVTGGKITQQSSGRRLELAQGLIESYYNNQLAMRFGQFSLEFYNRINDSLGRIIPISDTSNPNKKGLGIIVDNDILNIGFEKGGLYRAILRTDFVDSVTTISGPYNNLNAGATLRLFANRRQVSEGRFTSHDQPAIILDQSDTSNDIDIWYGGFGRRTNASTYFRHRTSSSTYSTKMRIAHNFTRIYDELRIGSQDHSIRIEPYANSVQWKFDQNNYIRQTDIGNFRIYAGGNVNFEVASNGRVDVSGALRIPSAYENTTSNSVNLHIFSGTGRLARSTSARKYKQEIEVAADLEYRKILDLNIKSWYDKGEIRNNGGSTEGLKRYYGLIADEFSEIGLSEFAVYDKGEIENYSDRAWTLLIPNINELKGEIGKLKLENQYLKTKIKQLEEKIA
ncbi:gp58-like family protein [Halalkalibacter sp. APA_J-10(15)]|uniref:phage tail protein n=1 Tax=Halalkalibacter sp. APA_J-10(15) TaxID=2933805 RepID=UPI001FF1192E|nr:gp58-like family protein [Halalkalibacter sp. APA_J-10(15)]MCK0473775.1 gp58-like family protein [Halalkalibacter sp. APA_J-10(15)]